MKLANEGSSPLSPNSGDPLVAPRRLLAEIHAETQHEEKRLRLMHTAGMDHFSQGLAKAVPTMTDADLDGYTREAGALAAMREGRRI
jgi:hypothetical protein